MLYGIDIPLALGLLALWLAAGILVGRLPTSGLQRRRRVRGALLLTWAALVAAGGYGLGILAGLSWVATPGHAWLYLMLTALPAAVVGVVAVPRMRAIRAPTVTGEGLADAAEELPVGAAQASLVVPVQAAALAALVNLYFLFAPYPVLRAIDVAVPVVLLALWTAATVFRHARRGPAARAPGQRQVPRRTRIARIATSFGTVVAFVIAWAGVGVATAPDAGPEPPAPAHSVRTGTVATEGDELYFEVRGDGPPLLMIPGGLGDAGFYEHAAEVLAEDYRVISYDRRGNSRSTRNFPSSFEVAQQARDAVAVMQAAGHDSAHVFGNSAGAIIAFELAAEHPGHVQTVVAHEPPSVQVLADGEKWLGMFASVYRTSFVLDPATANMQFSLSLRAVPFSAFGHTPEGFGERTEANQDFFIRHEMLPLVNYRPDTARIAANGVDIVVAAGELTLATGTYYGRTAPVLAAELGHRAVAFPGHHLSYMDTPEEWSQSLRDTLEDE